MLSCGLKYYLTYRCSARSSGPHIRNATKLLRVVLIATTAGGLSLSGKPRGAHAQATTTAPSSATNADLLKIKAAATSGDAAAQYQLADIYYSGTGVPQDFAEAVKWARKAADQGHTEAMYMLGGAYHYGEGVTRNFPQAIRWYREAANRGSSFAQNELGVMHEKGEGVPKDYVLAAAQYTKAANAGVAEAQANLGAAYMDGRGVIKDNEKARAWLTKAARTRRGDCGQIPVGAART